MLSRDALKLDSQEQPYLTPKEEEIIRATTPEGIRSFLRLRTDNLFRHKENIIGFRTDDALSLLHNVSRGFIPISTSSMMDKGGQELFFLSANPESSHLQQHSIYPDIEWDSESEKTFDGAIERNQEQYQQMGVQVAIFRNIGDILLKKRKKIFREIEDKALGDIHDHESDELNIERFFQLLGEDVFLLPAGASISRSMQFNAIHALRSCFTPKDFKIMTEFLSRIHNRGSIIVAFGPEILQKCSVSGANAQDANEITVDHPEKKIDTRHIVGFEALGD